ncbi:MAG: hypothetical protein HYY68_08810 [Thaumarchaeota archaeon]|nr:hypothetical protein [Nitrososphaerota archaeon]
MSASYSPPTPSRGIGTAPIILEGATLETYFVSRDSPGEAKALIIVTDAQVTSLTHYLKPHF